MKMKVMSIEQIDRAITDLSEDWNGLQLADKQNIIEVIDNDPAEFARLVRSWLQDDIDEEAGETICANCLENGDIVALEEVSKPERLEGVTVYYKAKICRSCGWEA